MRRPTGPAAAWRRARRRLRRLGRLLPRTSPPGAVLVLLHDGRRYQPDPRSATGRAFQAAAEALCRQLPAAGRPGRSRRPGRRSKHPT